MDSGLIGTIIQGGSVGVALVALGILYKVIINDHSRVDIVIDTIQKNAIAHTTLAKAIESLDKTVQSKL